MAIAHLGLNKVQCPVDATLEYPMQQNLRRRYHERKHQLDLLDPKNSFKELIGFDSMIYKLNFLVDFIKHFVKIIEDVDLLID